MKNKFNVSASPHTRGKDTTATIMRDVMIALMPAALFGVYQFGLRALVVLVLSVTTCVLSEYIYMKLMKLPRNGYECSAMVTGLLLGMNLPAGVPLWVPVLGGVFAIIVVKMLFGGLGQNFMNPALAARCFLLISCGRAMADFTVGKVLWVPVLGGVFAIIVVKMLFGGLGQNFMNPALAARCFLLISCGRAMADFTVGKVEAGNAAQMIFSGAAGLDGLSSATPLAAIRAGENVSLADMFFGFTGGTIGETSAFLILAGGVYLLARRVISIRIPAAYLLSFVVFMGLFGGHGFDPEYLAMQVCGGGLMLGAFFMATDYVTSPITPTGKIIFGIFLGILTGIFRVYGGSAEGVSYAIITGNILVPLIEKVTLPRAFGKGGKANV